MPRFHFDYFQHGRWVTDEEGTKIVGAGAVRQVAFHELTQIAGEMAQAPQAPEFPLILKMHVRLNGSAEVLHTMSLTVMDERN